MKRRKFIARLGSVTFAWPLTARAQQRPMPVVGFLNVASPDGYQLMPAAFRKGLQESGYVEGRSVVIQYCWATGRRKNPAALLANELA